MAYAALSDFFDVGVWGPLKNPAWPHAYYTSIIPMDFVRDVLQDFHHELDLPVGISGVCC